MTSWHAVGSRRLPWSAKRCGTPSAGRAQLYLGIILGPDDPEGARELQEQALAGFRQLRDARWTALALLACGDRALGAGDLASARSLFDESLGLFRRLDDAQMAAEALNKLGDVARSSGEHRHAAALYTESLELLRRHGGETGLPGLLHNLGHLTAGRAGGYAGGVDIHTADWRPTSGQPRLDQVRLHVVSAGPEDGPLVVLLHGFPDFWYGWRRQIGPLAKAGCRVVVPDQRGYNLSDKPAGLDAYRLDVLAEDVATMIRACGRARAHAVVGHDWGGGVAWWLALTRPALVERLVIVNAPHPGAAAETLRRDPRQWLRSWYMLAFQLPRLPELACRRNDWRPLVSALRRSSQPGTFSDVDLVRYRRAWSQPGAFTAMLNWYRALLRRPPSLAVAERRAPMPTLILWGLHDVALRSALAYRSVERCADGRLETFGRATHWVHNEEPQRVNDLLLTFLSDGHGDRPRRQQRLGLAHRCLSGKAVR